MCSVGSEVLTAVVMKGDQSIAIPLPSQNKTKQTPWPESASELYRPSDRRLSAKLVPTLTDRGCCVVSATDSHSQIL
jgi:hypothetical protein